ncbi:MAG: transporter [Tidjanibacter sp.]|nr:transporter [Tidjanibacter sp.]
MNPTVKKYTLPVALVLGVVFHGFWHQLYFLSPYVIFAMLFITFSKVSPRDMRPHKMHWPLLAFQFVLSFALYFALCGVDDVLAQGLMMCIFMPAAMASATVGGLLGANVTVMTTFILLSNVIVAVVSPFLFSMIGVESDLPFFAASLEVFKRIARLLILPLVCAWLLEWLAPKAHAVVKKHQEWSFYIWAVTLMMLMGTMTDFFLEQSTHNYVTEILLAVGSLAICILQFVVGHHIGKKYGDKPAGTQSLGQKNTTLAIWMSLTFLNPLSAIAPACYVVWQNVINSWQIARKK